LTVDVVDKALTVDGQKLNEKPFRTSFIVYSSDVFFTPTINNNNNNTSDDNNNTTAGANNNSENKTNDLELELNSLILSASITGLNIVNLSDPVTLVFRQMKVSCTLSVVCKIINKSKYYQLIFKQNSTMRSL